MFERTADGIPLRFHLAGINNQNFLMRDEQTGTFWQQISGRAVSGPLKGRTLTLVPADELSYALWKSEEPQGTVLQDVRKHIRDYASTNWDIRMARAPTVISYAQAGLKARELMLGVHAGGQARAYPYQQAVAQKLIEDRLGPEPIMVVLGPDNVSVRVFSRKMPGSTGTGHFYRVADSEGLLLDAETGSRWDFRGCIQVGKLKGACLPQVNALKDYWFDWRNYNPGTTVYGVHQRIQ